MRIGTRAWVVILGGLVAWAIHMLGLYAVFSWIDLAPANERPGRIAAVVLTLACALAAGWAAVFAFRDRRSSPDLRAIGGWGGVVSVIAIVFQSAPIFLS